jgi:hypothetical protein
MKDHLDEEVVCLYEVGVRLDRTPQLLLSLLVASTHEVKPTNVIVDETRILIFCKGPGKLHKSLVIPLF